MSNFVNSIEKVVKVHTTNGSNPIEVTCDDYSVYICKYGNPIKLLNEYISYEFLKLFEIPTPDYAFVNLHEDHYPDFNNPKYTKQSFQHPLFGSKIINGVLDITQFFHTFKGKHGQLNKIVNRYPSLLKIAIFDLWVANLDRNYNNLNLLLATPDSIYKIVAIDHTEIFDGCRLGQTLGDMTLEDSILYSNFSKVVFSNKKILRATIENVIADLYICIAKCEQSVESIVDNMPPEWNLDPVTTTIEIKKCIFDKEWIKQVVTNFRKYVQLGIIAT